MLRDVAPTGSMRAGLARRFWWPRFALLCQVPSFTGKKQEGRIVDFLAVDLWAPPGVWICHLIDEKQSAQDTARERDAEKSAPFGASFRWIACAPNRVQSIRSHVPDGWGLLSVGTGGEPRVIREAVEREAHAPGADLVRGLLRAGGNASPPPAPMSKILPRRAPRTARAAVTLLDMAFGAIEHASPEQLAELERALRARRAA